MGKLLEILNRKTKQDKPKDFVSATGVGRTPQPNIQPATQLKPTTPSWSLDLQGAAAQAEGWLATPLRSEMAPSPVPEILQMPDFRTAPLQILEDVQPRIRMQTAPAPDLSAMEFNKTKRIARELGQGVKSRFQTGTKGAEMVPGVGGVVGSARNLQLLDAAQRLSSGFDYKKPIRPAEFRPGAQGHVPARYTNRTSDEKLIADYILELQRQQNLTGAGKVGAGITQLPTWMIEFGMTGGLASLGNQSAKKAGTKLLKQYAETKAGRAALGAAGWSAGAITRASLGLAPRVAESALQRQVTVQILNDDEEGWATSFLKGWGDVVIEAASEEAGETITGVPSKLLQKTRLGKAVIPRLQSAWMKATGGSRGAFARELTKTGGYSNIIGEIGEERLGTILRAATNVNDFGAGKDSSVTERLKAGLVQDWENMGVEAVILSVPMAAQVAGGQIMGGPSVGPQVEQQPETDIVDTEIDAAEKERDIENMQEAARQGRLTPAQTKGALEEIRKLQAELEDLNTILKKNGQLSEAEAARLGEIKSQMGKMRLPIDADAALDRLEVLGVEHNDVDTADRRVRYLYQNLKGYEKGTSTAEDLATTIGRVNEYANEVEATQAKADVAEETAPLKQQVQEVAKPAEAPPVAPVEQAPPVTTEQIQAEVDRQVAQVLRIAEDEARKLAEQPPAQRQAEMAFRGATIEDARSVEQLIADRDRRIVEQYDADQAAAKAQQEKSVADRKVEEDIRKLEEQEVKRQKQKAFEDTIAERDRLAAERAAEEEPAGPTREEVIAERDRKAAEAEEAAPKPPAKPAEKVESVVARRKIPELEQYTPESIDARRKWQEEQIRSGREVDMSKAPPLVPKSTQEPAEKPPQAVPAAEQSQAKIPDVPSRPSSPVEMPIVAKVGKPGLSIEGDKFGLDISKAVVMRDDAGNVMGAVSFSIDPDTGKLITGIDDEGQALGSVSVFVKPEFRRQGIATALFDYAKQQGYDLDTVDETHFTEEGEAFARARRGQAAPAAELPAGEKTTQAEPGEKQRFYHGGEPGKQFYKGMSWWSENKAYAEKFKDEGGEITEASLSMNNPLDAEYETDEKTLDEWTEWLENEGIDPPELIDWAPDYGLYTFFDLLPHAGNNYLDNGLVQAIKDAGYDGIIAPEETNEDVGSGEVRVIFDESQIEHTPPTEKAAQKPPEQVSVADTYTNGLQETTVFKGGEVKPGQAAWRSMGQVEFDALMAGGEVGGLSKAQKKGGWFSWYPSRAAAEEGSLGKPKYLVEFGGFAVEGEALTQPARRGDITGIWISEGKGWTKYQPELSAVAEKGEAEAKPEAQKAEDTFAETMLMPRLSPSKSNKSIVMPAKVGDTFTPEQKEWLKKRFKIREGQGGRLVTYSNDEVAAEMNKLSWAESQSDRIAREKREDREQAEKARRDAEAVTIRDNPQVVAWIDETFGSDAMNTVNKAALVRYIIGEDKKFNGLPNNKWLDGLRKIEAIAGEKVDYPKIKSAFEAQKAEVKPSETEKGKTLVLDNISEDETLSDRLSGRKSAAFGTVTDTKNGRVIKLRFSPDTSELGTYSVILSYEGRSQTNRMMYKGGTKLRNVLKMYDDYMNVDEPGRFVFDIMPTAEAIQAREQQVAPKTWIQQKRSQLRKLKQQRFKTANDERMIRRISRQLKENPNKWQEGHGVGWRIGEPGSKLSHVNRGLRIVEVRPETHQAVVKFIQDVGQLADYKHGSEHLVDMVDLIRDKQFDVNLRGPTQTAVGATRSPQIDRALQDAVKRSGTVYVYDRRGKAVKARTAPAFGDYYAVTGGQVKYVEGQKTFATELEAIKAAQYIIKNTEQPMYVWETDKGFEISNQKPDVEHVELKRSHGVTKAERKLLGKQKAAEFIVAQEEGQDVGFKAGEASATAKARETIDRIRRTEKFSEKLRGEAADIVRQFVPKELQGRYINRILNAKTNKRIERLTAAIQKYIDKAEQRQARRDFVKFVKNLRSETRRGEVAFGKLPDAVRVPVMQALEQYDLAKLSKKKRKQLESRDTFVKRVAAALADGYENLDPDMDKSATDLLLMGTRRIAELQRLGKTYIGDLTADQIRYVHATLEHLVQVNDAKGQSKGRRRVEELLKDLNDARQEVAPSDKEYSEQYTGLIGTLRWIALEGQSQIRTMVGWVTGKDNRATKKLLVDELRRTLRLNHAQFKEFVEYFRKELADRKVKYDDIASLNEIVAVTLGGKKIKLSRDTLLTLYALTQAEGNLTDLLTTEGLNITTYLRPENKVFRKQRRYETGPISLAELRALSALIPDAHKQLVEAHFATNYDKQAPAINQMSMDYQNYPLARKKRYFHLSRDVQHPLEGTRADTSGSVDMLGRYLPKVGGTARINIKPFSREVMEGMKADAMYSTMLISLENARTLLANKKWRAAMRRNGHGRALDELTTMFRRVQGLSTEQNVLERAAWRVLGRASKGLLSLRVSGGLVQIASVPAAAETIPLKYMAGIDAPTPGQIKELQDKDASLWMRWKGRQYDFVTGLFSEQNPFEAFLFDRIPVSDKMLKQYTIGDQIALHKLYKGARRFVSSTTNLKKGTAEYDAKVLDVLHESLDSQPQWDMLFRSPLTSSPSVFLRTMTLFMSARNAQRNVLIRAVDDFRKGRISKAEFAERTAGVGMANVSVSVARRAFRVLVGAGALGIAALLGYREPDEAKRKAEENALKQLAKIPEESLFNVVGLGPMGQLFTAVAYTAERKLKYGPITDLSDIRTGNLFADLSLDMIELGSRYTALVEQYMSKEKYKSGPNKDKLKWHKTAIAAGELTAQLIATSYGLPWEGPKADFVWPSQSALRKSKTVAELEAELKELKYKETKYITYQGRKRKVYKNQVKLGQKEKYEKISKEIDRRKGK